ATDNCGTATVVFTQSDTAGNCPNNYIITRTWTATDLCNNVTTHTQTLTVQDTTAPTFVETLPSNVTVECSNIPTPVVLTATDNCGTAAVVYNQSINTGNCEGNYTIIRTWTATDLCNNITTHIQTVTVQDTTAPTFNQSLPQNVTLECSSIPVAQVLTATDNCGLANVNYSQTIQNGNCAGNYIVTRTWIAIDPCGNTTIHTQIITVQDTTAPTFVETLPSNITVECSTIPTPVVLTANDNCGTATVVFTQSNTAGNCPNNYIITRTWTATDLCGNQTVHIQTLTVQDTTAPTFVETLPSNVTVECSNIPTPVVLTATDNCGTATVVFTQSDTAGNCPNNYIITRTWTATDLCNNVTTHIQTVTVQDTTAPVFVQTLPANITVECSNVPAPVVLTATDNCGTATVVFNQANTSGTCSGYYTITRTWTATDLCNNQTVHVQTITVQDTTAPVFVQPLPANITVECSNVPVAQTFTATDNCGPATVTFNQAITAGNCQGNYIITRTWIATDLCGNTTPHIQVINVQDTVAPTFVETLPSNLTVECSNVPAPIVLTAVDNCGTASVVYVQTNTSGTCAGNYIITRTWTATDLCGLQTVHVQTITVQDTTAPTFVETLPSNVTVQCSTVPVAIVLTATDNCGTANVTFTETSAPGTCTGSYILTRTWTATDSCNNATTHVQTVTVQDTTAPTFVETLPSNITVECSSVPTAATLTAIDNCGTANVTFTETNVVGSCAGSYTLTRTWIATDSCNNTTTHVQIVTVQDTIAPTLTSPFTAIINATCDAIPASPVLTFTDACATQTQITIVTTEVTSDVTSTGTYTIIRTWTVSDACNNSQTFTQTVNVTIPNYIRTTTLDTQCNIDIDLTIDLTTIINQQFPGTILPTGTFTDVSNSGELSSDGFFTPYDLANGSYIVRYENNDLDCPRIIDIIIPVNQSVCDVDSCQTLEIRNAFTPNDDNVNEHFQIDNITTECYEFNTVEIYNRWGVLVYETQNYNNVDRAFRGISEGRNTVKQDSELPTGTYFYIIKFNSVIDDIPPRNGYLYLSR
uniref:HYR-like domain-containing protein n=1 Tax=Flavobacterium sp. TaxID=239 RepID=UPI003751147A